MSGLVLEKGSPGTAIRVDDSAEKGSLKVDG
jgi:hypothetical protein